MLRTNFWMFCRIAKHLNEQLQVTPKTGPQ